MLPMNCFLSGIQNLNIEKEVSLHASINIKINRSGIFNIQIWSTFYHKAQFMFCCTILRKNRHKYKQLKALKTYDCFSIVLTICLVSYVMKKTIKSSIITLLRNLYT